MAWRGVAWRGKARRGVARRGAAPQLSSSGNINSLVGVLALITSGEKCLLRNTAEERGEEKKNKGDPHSQAGKSIEKTREKRLQREQPARAVGIETCGPAGNKVIRPVKLVDRAF